MAAIPNEHIVKNFTPRDKKETVEQGVRMDSAGAKDMKSANDFLTRVQEPSTPNVGEQIGFDSPSR
jgi:hypothetical protein